MVEKKGTSLLLEEVNSIFCVLKLFIIRVDLQFLFFLSIQKWDYYLDVSKLKKEDEI